MDMKQRSRGCLRDKRKSVSGSFGGETEEAAPAFLVNMSEKEWYF